jgi:drug/metabolite transporter (DMT)-like permease
MTLDPIMLRRPAMPRKHPFAGRHETLAVLALIAAALFWSGNFIAGRALRDDIGPVALNLVRWGLCLALLLPLVSGRLVRHRRVVLREWRLLLGLGATGIATFHTLTYQALSHTTAVNALLILALAPAAIMAGARLTGDSRPGALQWMGCLVSLAGAGVLITRADPSRLHIMGVNPGDLWMLAAVLVWTVYSLLLRRRPADLPQDVTLAASIAVALAMLVPAFLVTGATLPRAPGPGTVAAILYIAVFASLVAFLLWSFGVNEIGAARAGQFVYLMPVFGPVLAVVILGERLGPAQIAGGLCVLAGIALVNRPPRARHAMRRDRRA